jgi:tRNA (cytidine/uridine-2'-O-)-methyltransferase
VWEDSAVFHVMLFSPRIPGNTGALIRLNACTGGMLHLIEPLGFELSDTKLKRSGLDYHDMANVRIHPNIESAFDSVPSSRIFAFRTQGTVTYTSVNYERDDVLLFGPEPSGLPPEVWGNERVTQMLRIPMLAGRRSLNLANSVSIAVYEAWRQHDFGGADDVETLRT